MYNLNMTKTQQRIDKLFHMMWKKYNRKSIRPPIELVNKIRVLQGKQPTEYETFDGIKLPWDDTITPTEYVETYSKSDTPVICDYGCEGLTKMKWDGVDKLTENTSMMDILTNKILINPQPNYDMVRSNRGYDIQYNDQTKRFTYPEAKEGSTTIKIWEHGVLVDTGKPYPPLL